MSSSHFFSSLSHLMLMSLQGFMGSQSALLSFHSLSCRLVLEQFCLLASAPSSKILTGLIESHGPYVISGNNRSSCSSVYLFSFRGNDMPRGHQGQEASFRSVRIS